MSDRIYWPDKDPTEALDYGFDWRLILGTSGDTITTSSWAVTNGATGLTLGSSSNDTQSTTQWLSAGTDGVIYEITNTVVTAQGRTYEQTAVLLVKEN